MAIQFEAFVFVKFDTGPFSHPLRCIILISFSPCYSCIFSESLSSSEFVVDEECILQLFKSCKECSRQCTVRKHVKGLKIVVSQACCFCESRYKWTNLPDDDNGDFQKNGKDAAHGQTNSAMSPSSNTSWDSVMSEMTVQLDSDCAEIMLNEEYVKVFS